MAVFILEKFFDRYQNLFQRGRVFFRSKDEKSYMKSSLKYLPYSRYH